MAGKGFEGDWLTRQKRLLPIIALATAFASAAPAESAAQSSTIFVANVADLYTAVNEPTNAGATIVLAAGTYTLSASQPNGGRLDLQLDMSLVGVENDAGAVIIDASALPQMSFNFTIGRTGIIRTGRGNNTIEWLTVQGNPFAAAAISTDLVQTVAGVAMPTTIRVAHVVAGPRPGRMDGSARGVDIRNATVATKGRRIVGEIEDSEFSWGVEGIRFANFVGADHGEIAVDMRRNHSHQNRVGCIFENNRSSNATIAVTSDGDLFDDNGLGCQIGGGLANAHLVNGLPGSASFNTTRFDAHGSSFTNNTRTEFNTAAGGPMFTDKGGLFVSAGELLGTSAPPPEYFASGNAVIVRLWDCDISGNHDVEVVGGVTIEHFDLQAFGARSDVVPSSDDLAGTDNHVLIQLRGMTAAVDVVEDDSDPDDPNGTDTVTVVRIPTKQPDQ
jgi:hypothetical protein